MGWKADLLWIQLRKRVPNPVKIQGTGPSPLQWAQLCFKYWRTFSVSGLGSARSEQRETCWTSRLSSARVSSLAQGHVSSHVKTGTPTMAVLLPELSRFRPISYLAQAETCAFVSNLGGIGLASHVERAHAPNPKFASIHSRKFSRSSQILS